MEPTEEEFFANIKTMMEENEVPYRAGSWENFQQQQKRKKGISIFTLIPAAAVITIGCLIYLWPQTDHPTLNKQHTVQIKTNETQIEVKVQKQKIISQGPDKKQRHAAYQTKKEAKGEAYSAPAPITADHFTAAENIKTAQTKPALKNNSSPPYKTFNETSENPLTHTYEPAWKFSVLASTIYGSSNLKVGFGASIDLHISKRITLSSGIAYNQLGSKTISNNNNGMMASSPGSSSDSEKTLESVYTNVSGIDIPLELKYNLNKSTYIGFGLSALAILRQDQTRNYQGSKVITQSYTDQNGEVRTESKVVEEDIVETIRNKELSNKSYLGFYNFSIGHRQKITTKQYITIEPYLKVPIQTFSTEKIKLVSGGVRLKIDL